MITRSPGHLITLYGAFPVDPSFFHTPIAVRFKDIDAMGHVNNAVFTTYFEEARAAFCREVLGIRTVEDFDFIVARIEINYRRPLRYGEPLSASVRVAGVGATSFALEYRLTIPAGDGTEVVAEGLSVQVFFDYARGVKKSVPEAFRRQSRGYFAPGVA
jgi:acyl-CoA thioester hydrolase